MDISKNFGKRIKVRVSREKQIAEYYERKKIKKKLNRKKNKAEKRRLQKMGIIK